MFYVINYEAVAAELPSLRALLRFKRIALVLDESHRIKTPGARVTRAVHALRVNAAKRYIMTGTPVANKPEDLWSQCFFLDDGERWGGTSTRLEHNSAQRMEATLVLTNFVNALLHYPCGGKGGYGPTALKNYYSGSCQTRRRANAYVRTNAQRTRSVDS